jgi:hypothetical protein
MGEYHLAQLNIARARGPMDGPIMADFKNNLDAINGLAEKSPGFVWRLKDDSGNATDIRVFDDPMLLVNLTVWESIESLHQFTYQSQHTDFYRRRSEWFHKLETPVVVLWWVWAGEIPTLEEAKARLDRLCTQGPTPFAFTFKQRFYPADSPH